MKTLLSLLLLIFLVSSNSFGDDYELKIPDRIASIEEYFFDNNFNVKPIRLKEHFKLENGNIIYEYNQSFNNKSYSGSFWEKGISNDDWDLFHTDYTIHFNKDGFKLDFEFNNESVTLNCKIRKSIAIPLNSLNEGYGSFGTIWGYWEDKIILFPSEEINDVLFEEPLSEMYTKPLDCPDIFFGSGLKEHYQKRFEIKQEDFYLNATWEHRPSLSRYWDSKNNYMLPSKFIYFLDEKKSYEDVIAEEILLNKINPKDLDLTLHKISPLPDKECKDVKAENFDIKSFLIEHDIWLDKRYLYPDELKSFQFYYLVDNIAYKKEIINQNNDQIALQIFCLGVPDYEYENRIILTQLYYNWKNDNPPTYQEILEFKNDAQEIRLNGELRYFNGSIIALAEKKDGSDIGVYVYKPLEKKWKKSKLIDYKNLFNSPELLPPRILTEFENTGNGWKIISNFKGDDFGYYN